MQNHRFTSRRFRDPFTALLLFGAAGIVAMTVAFAVTGLPRPAPSAPAASLASPATAGTTQVQSTATPVAKPQGGDDGGGD